MGAYPLLKHNLMANSLNYRLIILLFSFMTVVSCSNQSTQKINFNKLDLSHQQIANATDLMLAAEQGNAAFVKKAIEQGDLINSESPNGTAFSLAIKNKHFVISQFLLTAGSDFQRGFQPGDSSALMIAADQAKNKLVKDLIVRGANLNYEELQGESAITKAARKGHLTTLKILINAGANVNVAPAGRSVLMQVVGDNNMLLSQLLIAGGANVNYRDNSGDTALKIARRLGYFDLDLMLVQSGARP
jgi:ankyrin repeat protein